MLLYNSKGARQQRQQLFYMCIMGGVCPLYITLTLLTTTVCIHVLCFAGPEAVPVQFFYRVAEAHQNELVSGPVCVRACVCLKFHHVLYIHV